MNKTFGRKLKQGIGILLAAAVVFNMLPLGGLAVSASENSGTGICEHHTEHTEDCGYAEAEDCRHEHTEECYTAEGELDCHHEHDEDCGYAKAHECTYVCEICNNEASGEEDAEDDDAETTEENSGNTYECICKELCTEDNIEKDCPVCGVEDADFSSCKGKEMEDIEDVETEDRDFEDVNSEDTGLCEHHTEHTKDCGYSPASEDGEGSPCTYECRICPIEDLIAALPDEVTQDNAETVQAQLEEILSLYTELTEDEQEQIDLTLVYKLQADLDAANVRCEVNTNYIASVTVNGVETRYTSPESFVNAVKDASGTVTVELLQKEVDLGSLSLTVPSDVTLTLDGGECTLTSSGAETVIVNGTFNFKGGTLLNTNQFGTAVTVFGSFTMSGGMVDCANNIGFAVTLRDSSSSGTITGGTVGVNNGGLSTFGTVVLSGGTYSSIFYGVYTSKPITVANILASGYALQGTDGLIRGDTSLSTPLRNVTVVPCTHAGAGKDNGDGTHSGECPYCGTEFAAESHTLGAGNVCEGCNAALKVKVERSDGTIVYLGEGDFANAFDDRKYNNVTVTLLSDIQADSIEMGDTQASVHVLNTSTLDLAGHTITSSDTAIYVYPTGNLTIKDSSSGKTGQVVSTGSAAILTQTPMVSLIGGTYTGKPAIDGKNSSTDVSSLLANYGTQTTPHYAYFDAQGNPVALEENQRELTGTVTVKECTHPGVKASPNNDGTHSLKCPYCGYTGTEENCSYGTAYQHDENSHLLTCTVCGYEKVETHTLSSYSVEENGSITFFGQCGKCKYDKVIGTAQLTIPQDLVYGQTGEKTISVETEMPYDKITLKLDWDGGEVENTSIDLPADLSAGRHSVYTSIYIEGVQNVSVVYFTVEKAPLTMDMVTLSPESVTYSGEEQKPTIAVKQGEAALVEGTDCDVICSTTDFTSAGTIIFTITGKGNYKGTVEKTYTIKKAVLTATGTGIANGTYGAKLSELSITGLTAVYPGTTTEVPGTWKLTGDTIPGVDDSGKYTAAFTPANGAGNYETLTAQVTLNIEKAAAPAPQKGTLYVQNNREQSYQYDLTQLLPALDNGKSYGTVKYALGENAVDISGDYYADGAKVTGTTLTLPIQKIETDKEGNIGEVTITITSGNYKDMSAVINVESVDKIPVTITGVSVEEREYNGKAIDCIGTPRAVDSSGNTVTIDDKEYKYTWQTADGMVLSGAPKDAGSYLLIVSVNNDTYMGSSMISFVIDRASIIITADSKTVSKGSAKPVLTYTISGLAAGEALAVEPTLTCNADMNTAGRYPITVSDGEVPNSNNYHTEITYIPGALTVTASASGGGSGSSGGGNSGGSGGNNNGNGSGSENNGDSGQGSSSDNGGVNTTPGVPTIPPVTDTNPGTSTDAVKPGTGNTVRTGTGTGTGSSAAQETMADTGIPFIKGEDGKIGWNVIRAEEEKAEEGTVINVDMNGTTVVPGDIFDSIKGRDVTITFDMGSGILWSVDGKSIITDKADDIDFTVRTGGSAVPVEIVNNVTGEHYSIQLSLAYDGEFGFTAVLSVNLGKENTGYTASLYYYNQNTGELEFVCADEVAEDGTVSFAFTHASDYVIVIDRISEEPAPESAGNITEAPAEEEGNSGEAVVSPKEIGKAKGSSMPWFILVGVAVVILGAAGILIWKRKKEEGNREAK